MTTSSSFGISSHLFHTAHLTRAHLLQVGSHGFRHFELYAAPNHFDYHNPQAVVDLQQWLAEAGLVLSSVHAPVSEGSVNGRAVPLMLASADAGARARALEETEQALLIARRIAFRTFIVHLGLPKGMQTDAADVSRDGARRSLESLHQAAAPLGVRIAVEVIANGFSRPESLVHFLEDVLETADVGVCLDTGHAHLHGDVVEAIETVSEHLLAVDLHDNGGRTDDHRMPFEGSIPWADTMTSLLKVGYEGPLMLELSPGREPLKDALDRAARARERLERFLE